MVTVSFEADGQQGLLQVWKFRHPGATEEVSGDFVFCKLAFAQVKLEFAAIRNEIAEGKGSRFNPALVTSKRTALADGIGEDRMLGNLTGTGHHILGYGTAVEENTLVVVIAVVVVPIKAGGDAAGRNAQGAHRYRAADIHLASHGETSVVHLAEQYAGGNAILLL